ncbi:hypothetical protein [Leucothrix mucor]|uniref:hypothetical protein n=1 Tax=Leucothrix mucor TaxID=45248 RepID=UPI0003B5D11E|nr:hypothetical protein [Leucothrix mucor]
MSEISAYLEEHRPAEQETIGGVIINPKQRSGFDDTPNEDRDRLEISDWWGKPYIRTYKWGDNLESWEEHVARMSQYPDAKVRSKEDYEEDMMERKQSWYASFPEGIKYEVHCLNGGAWDRPTFCGKSSNLEGALQIVKSLITE